MSQWYECVDCDGLRLQCTHTHTLNEYPWNLSLCIEKNNEIREETTFISLSVLRSNDATIIWLALFR